MKIDKYFKKIEGDWEEKRWWGKLLILKELLVF